MTKFLYRVGMALQLCALAYLVGGIAAVTYATSTTLFSLI